MSDFIPTPAQMLYGAESGSFAVPDWVDDMFTGMLRNWERVFWNMQQKSWEPEPCAIGQVRFQPYVWDACDCGGKEIQHKADCRWLLEHSEWNSRRLDALSGPAKPKPTKDQLDEAYASQGALGPWMLVMDSCSRELDIFNFDKSDAWVDANPAPPCTCGESEGWEERECAEQCISNRPNFGIDGDVIQIRWYKYPGRGMSVSVPLSPEQWIDWRDRVTAALAQAEQDHEAKR